MNKNYWPSILKSGIFLKFHIILPFFLFSFLLNAPLLKAQQASDFYVFSDTFDKGRPGGFMGAKAGVSLTVDSNCAEMPFKGASCLKVQADGTEAWSGLYIRYSKTGRQKDNKDLFANLNPYNYLVFYARSDKEYIAAKMGMGEHGEYSKEEGKIPLTKEWKRYVIELDKGDRSSVNGLFLLVFEGAGTVFLDEIKYTDKNTALAGDMAFLVRKTPLDSTAFYIYADKMINGIPTGYMGSKNGTSIKFDPAYSNNPYEGPKCIKVEIEKGEDWRGLHIQFTGRWNASLSGKEPLPDLTKYKKLIFYARTDGPNLSIPEIGVGTGDPLTEEKVSDTYIEVDKNWRKYEINIKGIELTRVNTLLFMVLPVGMFYLDEIRFK